MDDDFDELLFQPSSVGCAFDSTARSPRDEGAALPYRFRDNDILGDFDAERRPGSPFRELCSAELNRKPILPEVDHLTPLAQTPRSVEMPLLGPGPVQLGWYPWGILTRARQSVIAQIESVFEHQVDVLLAKQGSLFVTLKARTKKSIGTVQSTASACKERVYRFPGKSAEEAWRYSSQIPEEWLSSWTYDI
jgi:hypothetical protein